MKSFIDVKSRFEFALPSWYDLKIHNRVVEIISDKGKLHACKFLRDTSHIIKENWSGLDGRPFNQEMFVKEAKDICDFIVDVDGLMKAMTVSVPVNPENITKNIQVIFYS